MKNFIYGVVIIGALFLSGCTTSGAFLSLNHTQVNLQQDNYSIRAIGVSGHSEAGYVLGVSYSSGLTANTLAIGRVEGTGMLYKEALDNLWANYEKEHGSLSGKKLALTNVRYDTDILNLLFYTKVMVGVRADIIEFN